MYFVQSGRLKVFLSDAQGKEVVINSLGGAARIQGPGIAIGNNRALTRIAQS